MTKTIFGAELFAEGTWNGRKFVEKDIDGIATSFVTLDLAGRVPLKLGHEGPDVRDDPATQFALGWVTKVWRDGKRLLANVEVPDKVYSWIREGILKFVSVELLKDVQAGTRVIPWVLDAVALLGADQPAVGTLKDLQSLTMARKPAFRARARVAFKRGVNFFSTSGDKRPMDESEVQAAIAAAVAKALVPAKAEAHRAQIKAKFETAVKAEAMLPAKREQFYKLYRVDDDKSVIDIKLEDVDEFIEMNSDKKKLAALRKTATFSGDNGIDESGLRPDQVLHKRAEKLCYDRKQDPRSLEHYMRAVTDVMRDDSTLGESYKYMPDTQYRQAS